MILFITPCVCLQYISGHNIYYLYEKPQDVTCRKEPFFFILFCTIINVFKSERESGISICLARLSLIHQQHKIYVHLAVKMKNNEALREIGLVHYNIIRI